MLLLQWCSLKPSSLTWRNQVLDVDIRLNLKDLLISCVEATTEDGVSTIRVLLNVAEQRVSIFRESMQRLSADVLEVLKA